jgi:serine/threonine protein kinase
MHLEGYWVAMAVLRGMEPGTVLADRFRVRKRLGTGGTATVFLAEDCVLCRDVAIKRLHAEGSEADIRRFRREARLGASLVHPNLVTVFDTLSSETGVFIVMEHVRGRPLTELIGQRGMDPRQLLGVLRPIASALDYAHEHGVVHRDVKPANILIADDGTVKLVDLGTATAGHLTQITAENEVMGTLGYIAPERLAGESIGEPAADVYSLAVLASEALTGHKPYHADTPAELLNRIHEGPPPDLAEVPPHLSRVLAQGMDPDPGRRQASAGALVRDMEASLRMPVAGTRSVVSEPTEPMPTVLSGEKPQPRPFSPPPQVPRGRPRWLVSAVVLLVAAVAAGAWLAVSGGGSGGGGNRGGAHAATSHGSKRTPPKSAGAGATATATASTTPSISSDIQANSPTASPPSSGSEAAGARLNDEGYALIQEGRYDEAIPTLRRAVASFPQGTTDINYAYALFNLGHALRMAGHAASAIPILEERLQIPDQTATVQAELDAARAEAGR